MAKPLNLTFKTTDFTFSYKSVDFRFQSEIPTGLHPGAFGVRRKHHIHEGVDLYCLDGEPVFNMLDGVVIYKSYFTGELAGTPWWNNTECIMIKTESGVINYGEIIVDRHLNIGDVVTEGQRLGVVTQVLKTDKGRPLSMLHVELYDAMATKPAMSWNIDAPRPQFLMNPTELLMKECLLAF